MTGDGNRHPFNGYVTIEYDWQEAAAVTQVPTELPVELKYVG